MTIEHTPRRDHNPANRDPITDAPGAHPVGTGVGAAGGAATGAALGAAAGPVGMAVGGVVGAVAGGLAGKATAEMINPTEEDAYWRDQHAKQPYVRDGRDYTHYRDAYALGWEAVGRYPDDDYDKIEGDLAKEWQRHPAQGEARLAWTDARLATRAAWDRARGRLDQPAAGRQMDMHDVVDELNALIETSLDGKQGFETCAENAASPQIKSMLMNRAGQCAQAVSELQAMVRGFNAEPANSGTVSGALHRGWVSIKTTFSGDDDAAVLGACVTGEESAVERYDEALKKPLPAHVRSVVQRQRDGAHQHLMEVRRMHQTATA